VSTPHDRIEAKLGLIGPQLSHLRDDPPRIPDHELIRRIGRGAYGEVWLARNALGTWRAVKIVYRDNFKDARPYEREFAGIRRFEPLSRSNEGFVDILQVGRDDAGGWFYYVMELADAAEPQASNQGSVISNRSSVISNQSDKTAVCEAASTSLNTDHGPLMTSYSPRTLSRDLQQHGRLPLEQCLELGLTLSFALGHLHRHGLIHRDIKPSNIIFVGGVPKLADIGLVTEAEGANTFVGTEGFVPPEGPISPQADLYALGKVLYEAAMGKDRNEFPEAFTQIGTDRESVALMELNAVLLRACMPDRKTRYASAEEMHADLAILHSGGSVKRRHRLEQQFRLVKQVGAAAIVATLLIGAAWFWQRQQTKQMTRLAAEKSELAEDKTRLAEQSRQVAQFLKDMLKGVGPSVAVGRDTTLLREILDKTAARVGRDLKDQPEIEAELRTTLGQVYRDLGACEPSEAMLREALAIRRRLFGENASTADSLLDLSATLQSYSFRSETEAVYRSPPAALTAKLAEAESLSRQALALRRSLRGREHADVAEALDDLCNVLYCQLKLPEAEQCGREALAMARKLQPNDHPVVLASLNDLAAVLSDVGKLPEAEALYREALPLERKRLGDTHPKLASLVVDLGQVVKRQGRLAEAETLYAEAVAMERRLGRVELRYLAEDLNGLADVLQQQGKLAEAETSQREALALMIRRYGDEHIDVAAVLDNLGGVLLDQGKLEAAESLLSQALAMREKLLGNRHPHYAMSLAKLASVRERQGKLADAELLLRQAVEIESLRASDDRPYVPELPGSSRIVLWLDRLGRILLLRGKMAETETALRQARDYLRKPAAGGPPPQTPTLGRILLHLADTLNRLEASAEARAVAEEAVGLYRLHPAWPAEDRQQASELLRSVLMALGDLAAAEPLLIAAYEGMKQREVTISLVDKERLKKGLQRLVRFYQETNRPEKAAEWKQKVAEFDQPENK
jgi:serine/threonine protein kinase